MIDTLAIAGPWPLRTPVSPRQVVRLGQAKARVCDQGISLVWVEASLPRLLLGDNGRLIHDQVQVDLALKRLWETVNKYAEVPDPSYWQPTRIDLCWNFDLCAATLINAHYPLSIPGIRNASSLFTGGRMVSWRGDKSDFEVKMYDKARQLGARKSVLRCEVTLRRASLRKRLPGNTWQRFPDLWRAFQAVLSSIPPIPAPGPARGWQEAIGMGSQEIRDRILGRLADHPPRTLRRWRARAGAASLTEPFSWKALLSPHHPPEPIDVPAKGSQ